MPPGFADLALDNIHRRLPPDLLDGYHLAADVGSGDNPELLAFVGEWLRQSTGIEAETMLLSGSLDIMERALLQYCMPGAKVPDAAVLAQVSAVILTALAHSSAGICYSRRRWQAWQHALAPHKALVLVDDHWAALG